MPASDDELMNKRAGWIAGASKVPAVAGFQVLNRVHIQDAITQSSDDGCTLDFSNKNLIDVSDAGIEELVQLGRGAAVLR